MEWQDICFYDCKDGINKIILTLSVKGCEARIYVRANKIHCTISFDNVSEAVSFIHKYLCN